MKFSTRNAFYLRASNYRVVPLFLYLDERHVDWMSDRVMQLVIAEIQPKMSELLSWESRAEGKKHKVYVERGEGYQFCYFLRNTTRTEVVLLKQKSYTLRPPTPPPPIVPQTTPKRKRSISTLPRSSRARSRSNSMREESPLAEIDSDDNGTDPSGSGVKFEPPPSPRIGGVDDEEVNIKDWKPDVQVSYRGFGTSSVQLVLIVEPYPPLPPSEYAPPSSRLSSRSASIATSRSRSRQTTGAGGAGRYSSTSLSVALDGAGNSRSESVSAPNMRNATRSVSAVPNSRRGGTSTPHGSVTPLREASSTPGPGYTGAGAGARGRTPLFIPRDTPFGEDDEDEEQHEEYTAALREGRLRLPSVSRPAGTPDPEEPKTRKGKGKRSLRTWSRTHDEEEEDELDDIPESLEAMSGRLVRSSEIEESVLRVQGGWEERAEGEESAVMGREEPGD